MPSQRGRMAHGTPYQPPTPQEADERRAAFLDYLTDAQPALAVGMEVKDRETRADLGTITVVAGNLVQVSSAPGVPRNRSTVSLDPGGSVVGPVLEAAYLTVMGGGSITSSTPQSLVVQLTGTRVSQAFNITMTRPEMVANMADARDQW